MHNAGILTDIITSTPLLAMIAASDKVMLFDDIWVGLYINKDSIVVPI